MVEDSKVERPGASKDAAKSVKGARSKEGAAAAERETVLHQIDPKRNNVVRTTRYSLISFLPKVTFQLLSQATNAYFFVMAIFQCIPVISNTNGKPLLLIPLSFVLITGSIKEALEDRARGKQDKKKNELPAIRVTEDFKEQHLQSQELSPGMVFKIREGETVPADGLILATSDSSGRCFVETANLDGETNLKTKTAIFETAEDFEAAKVKMKKHKFKLVHEPPNVELYKFNGKVLFDGTHPATISNLILCGTALQQTDWVLCLATYCGHETRAMMNQRSALYKPSSLDLALNKVVAGVFCLQVVLCLSLTAASTLWVEQNRASAWYLDYGPEEQVPFLVSVGIWMLQTNNLIPAALMVTSTVSKFVQGNFIQWDRGCGDEEGGGKAAVVNVCQVLESMGQITHIFSDKTGTLTKNVMEYKACAVDGTVYGLDEASDGDSLVTGGATGLQLSAPYVDFDARVFFKDLKVPEGQAPNARQITLAEFWLVHALCHTVEVNTTGEEEPNPMTCPYKAASPDELALVSASRAVGLEFLSLQGGRAQLAIKDARLIEPLVSACGFKEDVDNETGTSNLVVEVLDLCEFDNDRKRMSVVVRYPNGRLVVLCKGADTSVLPYVTGKEAIDTCEQQLSVFARRGLRTLVLASRDMAEDEWKNWHERYLRAQAIIDDSRGAEMQKLQIELEVESGAMALLGATAIEDQLQDDVPNTIQQFRMAGLRVWVLTGDKVETAISIAYSCELLTTDMDNFVLEMTDPMELGRELELICESSMPAITVAGSALAAVLSSPELCRRFAEAAQLCRVVIACRVSPKQKADVVQLVRDQVPSALTLAIGDGANDVSMIIAAHVGVGISGKEGAQAAITADFAISEFRYLRRLLFVHGRESYRRLSILNLYFFFKNTLVIIPVILSAATSAFSGQNVVNPLLLQMNNYCYTQLPMMFYGWHDRAVADLDTLELSPKGYAPTIFSCTRAFVWIFGAAVQAFLINVLVFFMLGSGRPEGGMELGDIATTGDVRLVWLVLAANLTMIKFLRSWYKYSWSTFAFNLFWISISPLMLYRANPWHVTWAAITGDDMPRLALATVVVLFMNCLVDEVTVCNPMWIERALRCMQAWVLAAFCGAVGIKDDKAVETEGGKDARSTKEIELMPLAPDDAEQDAPLVPPKVDKRPFLAVPDGGEAASGARTSRATSKSLMLGKRLTHGFAFSQECAIARQQPAAAARSADGDSDAELDGNDALARRNVRSFCMADSPLLSPGDGANDPARHSVCVAGLQKAAKAGKATARSKEALKRLGEGTVCDGTKICDENDSSTVGDSGVVSSVQTTSKEGSDSGSGQGWENI